MREYLLGCRKNFLYAGIFSFFVNILTLSVSIYMLQVFDRVFTSRSQETLLMLTIITVGALLVMMALDILRSRLLLAAGVALDSALGPKVLKAVLESASRGSGVESVNSLRDVAMVRGFLTGQGIISLFDIPWLPFYVFVIFLFHPVLGISALVSAALLLLLAWLNEKFTRRPIEETGTRSRHAAKFIDGGIRNAEVVSALGMLPAVTERWSQLNKKVIVAQVEAGYRSGLLIGISKFTRMMVQVGMMGLGAWLVIHQYLTAGGMMATTIILARALQPVESAIATWKGFVDARSAYNRLDEMLGKLPAETTPLTLPLPSGQLNVDKVIVQLRHGDPQILKGVSFELAPGESLGVIGPSAAGKTTLSRVLTGVWKPVAGTVRLDGAELFTWDKTVLGSYLGYLPQDVELFPGTVAENIARLGHFESEAVIAAAQRAFTHEMILQLPKGYDTDVGDGAVNLSAGQRQRIGLARALFGDPRLVVLDEPNASLDGEGEEALMKALGRMKQDRVTVVIISHKPSVLAQVDKMLVLREGRVELFGPRQEVLGHFAKAAAPVQQMSKTQDRNGT